MADLKAMRAAAEYRGGHGYMTPGEHAQWLALIACAEALKALEADEMTDYRKTFMVQVQEALAQLEKAP